MGGESFLFFQKVLRIFRRHLEIFKNEKRGVGWGGCCAFVCQVLACTFQRKEGNEFLFSPHDLFSVHVAEWWKNGGLNRLYAL